jgi:predicted nucleic acid-binding protein
LENIIWKDYFLHAKVSEQEAKVIAKTINHALNLMDLIEIAGSEDEILDTAIKLKITFYDAAYAYFAKAKDLRLITEDARLIKKITSTNAATLDSIK